MPSELELQNFHLTNAPIVEALIEIKLAEPLSLNSLEALKQCADGLNTDYPIRQDIFKQQFEMQVGHAPSGITETHPEGFFCQEISGHRVVHLKLDGFGLSELAPYSSWNRFFPEAQRIWAAYRLAIGGAQTGSWSIRYINQISWPEGERIEDYLNVYPALPKELPQRLMGCFMRLQSEIDQPSKGFFTQQIFPLPNSEPNKVSFIVDHDFSFSALGLTDEMLWQRIQSAQKVKNTFFKATITPKALEIFR